MALCVVAAITTVGCAVESEPDLASWVYRHSRAVKAVAISPNGELALTASDDRTVHVWEISTGEERAATELPKAARWAGFLDQETVLLADGSAVHRWRWVESSPPRPLADTPGIARGTDCVVVLPDGRSFLATPMRLCRYDLQTGALITCFGRRLAMDLQDYAVTSDGRLAATSRWSDGRIRLWDLATGEMLGVVGDHGAWVMSLAFTSDGRRLLSAGDQTVKMWDVEKRRQIGSFGEHPHDVWAIALTPDDSRLIAGAEDGTIHVWDVQSGTELQRLTGHAHQLDYPFRLAISPNGRLLLTGSRDWTARLWDLERPTGPPRVVGWESPKLAPGKPRDVLRLWAFPHWTGMLLMTVLVSLLGRLSPLRSQLRNAGGGERLALALGTGIWRMLVFYLPAALLVSLATGLIPGQWAGEHLAGNTVKIALLLAVVDALLERHRPRSPHRIELDFPFVLPIVSLLLYLLSVVGAAIATRLLASRFGYPPAGAEMMTALWRPPTLLASSPLNWLALVLLALAVGILAYTVQRRRMEESFGEWL